MSTSTSSLIAVTVMKCGHYEGKSEISSFSNDLTLRQVFEMYHPEVAERKPSFTVACSLQMDSNAPFAVGDPSMTIGQLATQFGAKSLQFTCTTTSKPETVDSDCAGYSSVDRNSYCGDDATTYDDDDGCLPPTNEVVDAAESIIPGVPEDMTLYAVSGGRLYRGKQPARHDTGDTWLNQAHEVGKGDWEPYKFILPSPDGKLYAVTKSDHPETDSDDTLRVGQLPTWLDRWGSEAVGGRGWGSCRFVFFDSAGALYAVSGAGALYRGPPPTGQGEQWLEESTKIGAFGWDDFKFLFCHPTEQILYAVSGNVLCKASPPTDRHDYWMNRSEKIEGEWGGFNHLFFSHHGTLYGITEDGEMYAGKPPTSPTDDWKARAVRLATKMDVTTAFSGYT